MAVQTLLGLYRHLIYNNSNINTLGRKENGIWRLEILIFFHRTNNFKHNVTNIISRCRRSLESRQAQVGKALNLRGVCSNYQQAYPAVLWQDKARRTIRRINPVFCRRPYGTRPINPQHPGCLDDSENDSAVWRKVVSMAQYHLRYSLSNDGNAQHKHPGLDHSRPAETAQLSS